MSPNLQVDQLNPDLGLFVQDQWRLNRVTISAGLRFDWLRESVAASSVPGRRAGARRSRSRPSRTCPNWKDLSPRFGIVWDPTGDGKTAIKFGINRYVQSATTGIAQPVRSVRPGQLARRSTARTWGDTNGNFLPDCDLRLKTANGECGAMVNPNFGTNVPSYRPDSDWVNGWGKRPYNWQTSISIDREILPYLVVNAGYYRTWYGNFMVIDNQRVTPDGLQPVLRDRADRLAPAAQRPAAVRPLRPQPEQVRTDRQPRHARQELRQAARRSTTAST